MPTPAAKPPTGPKPAPSENSVVQKVDWADFRDHLSTADQEGHRMWVYPRKPAGRFHRARAWLSALLLLVMFGGPFVRINGEPLLMMNVVDRQFVILAIGLLVFLTGIAVFTAAFGRLWCGWLCPQTVLMEMVFRKIEYFIEGDASEQRALDRAPWTAAKTLRKLAKHGAFLALSFLVGNTLLAYIIGTDALYRIVTDNPANHLAGLTFMILFTLLFYGIFARFREQACTFICPYGRFQSTLLDENSIVVAYDFKRGEQRGILRRQQSAEARHAAGRGDCIDCHQCVSVCPTGIDIRNGTQMECVHCTACIDACDHVMDKIAKPRGLIRYASLDGIQRGEKRLKITPRLVGYSVLLVALIGLECFLLFNRTAVDTTLLRAPGSLYQQMPEGKIGNLYTVKLINKTGREIAVELRLENAEGNLRILGRELRVPPRELTQSSVLIEIDRTRLKPGNTPLVVGVYQGSERLQTIKTGFIGPR